MGYPLFLINIKQLIRGFEHSVPARRSEDFVLFRGKTKDNLINKSPDSSVENRISLPLSHSGNPTLCAYVASGRIILKNYS